MPDIRMPDGTIIRNVPDGTPRADVERKWKESTLKQRTANHPVLGPVNTFVGNVADMMTMGADDEVSAALDTVNPFSGNSGWRKGFGQAFSENQRSYQARKDQLREANPKSALAGSVVGALIPAFATGGSSLAAAPRVATGGRIARAARAIAPAAAQSAAYGFNSETGSVGKRLKAVPKAVAYGVGGDVAGRALGAVASRALRGQKVSPNVRLLADEGVTLTPGQRSGPGSLRNTFEDKVLGSIPFVSDVPAAAALRGQNDLRVATANRVLAPLGQNLPKGTPVNNTTMGQLQGTVYDALDNASGNLSLQPDYLLQQGLQNLSGQAPRKLGTEGAAQVDANIGYINDRLSRGPITGDAFRETLGDIRGLASKNASTQLGDELWAMHDELASAAQRQNPAQAVDAFNKAREATALLKRMEDAASKSVDGEFGPTQLLQAAKRRGYGTSTGNIANGEARLMDLANAAAGVMRNKTANSGTVPRAIAGGGMMGGVSGLAGMVDPTMGALTAGSMLGYVPGLDRVLQNFALNRPAGMRAAGDAIEAANRKLGLLGMGTGLSLYGR